MTDHVPNNPPFEAGKALWYRNVHFRTALERSGLVGFFQAVIGIFSSREDTFRPVYGLSLNRAIGRDNEGKTRWHPLARIVGENSNVPWRRAAQFLEVALDTGLLIPERALDGSPWVRLNLAETTVESDLLPKWLLTPYLTKLEADAREQVVQNQRWEATQRERADKAAKRRATFEAARSQYSTLGKLLAGELEGRSAWREIDIEVHVFFPSTSGRADRTVTVPFVARDFAAEAGFTMRSIDDLGLLSKPVRAFDELRQTVQRTGDLNEETFDRLLEPLLSCPLGSRRPYELSSERRERETTVSFRYYTDGRPKWKRRSCTEASTDSIDLFREDSDLETAKWIVSCNGGEWRIDSDNVWTLVESLIHGLWQRSRTQIEPIVSEPTPLLSDLHDLPNDPPF